MSSKALRFSSKHMCCCNATSNVILLKCQAQQKFHQNSRGVHPACLFPSSAGADFYTKWAELVVMNPIFT